jgi:Methyltransferase domain
LANISDLMSEESIPSLHTQLREGMVVLDSEFDAVYPVDVRIVSSCFWTPVSVARRAAELLVRKQNDRVLDVGSGVGKFCIVGAAATGATFVGIEQRLRLVGVAEDARQQIGAHSAHFVRGSFDTVDVRSFDAIYFFNPFEENLFEPDLQLDHDVHLGEERFSADVERAESLLRRARTGTRVVTYHGFGGEMPAGYDLIHRERHHADKLELWQKSAHET